MKNPTLVALSLLIAVVLQALGGGLSWLYYTDGPSHYIALAVGWPLLLAGKAGKDGIAIAIAFCIYFALSLLFLAIARRAIRRFG